MGMYLESNISTCYTHDWILMLMDHVFQLFGSSRAGKRLGSHVIPRLKFMRRLKVYCLFLVVFLYRVGGCTMSYFVGENDTPKLSFFG